MRVRRKVLVCLVAAVIISLMGLGVYWASLPGPEPALTLENFRRVRKGMTAEQVRAVMGSAPHHGTGDTIWWETDTRIFLFDLDYAQSVCGGLYEEYESADSNAKKASEHLTEGVLDKFWRWAKDWMDW